MHSATEIFAGDFRNNHMPVETSKTAAWAATARTLPKRQLMLQKKDDNVQFVARVLRHSQMTAETHRRGGGCCCRSSPTQSDDCGDSQIGSRPSIKSGDTCCTSRQMLLQESSDGDSRIGNRPSIKSGNSCCGSRHHMFAGVLRCHHVVVETSDTTACRCNVN